MQADYFVRVYDHEGVPFDLITRWASLKYTRTLNTYGTYELVLNYPHPTHDLWRTDTIVEVWRAPRTSGEPYCDFVGFHRGWHDELNDSRRRLVISRGVEISHLLQRRRILYPAVTAYTLKSGPGETVIKEYVNENLGPGAVAPRIIVGVAPWLRIAPDEGRGEEWFGHKSYVGLLETLQEIALQANIFFTITRPSNQVFEFTLLNPMTRQQVFSEESNTLLTFTFDQDAASVTAAVALGAEIGSARPAVPLIDAAAADSPWNLSETAVDVNLETYNELLTAAETEIERGKASQSLSLQINPRTQARYGADYALGDIITADIRGQRVQRRLSSVAITVEEGREKLEHTFEAVRE